MESKLMTKEQGTEWERANQLLKDIQSAMNALPRKTIPKQYGNTVFTDTYQIASAIGKFLKEVE